MPLTVDAIYENGVLKPATPLAEQAKVRITIEAAGGWVCQSAGILP